MKALGKALKAVFTSAGKCPTCGQKTKQNNSLAWCENCGFNITQETNNKFTTNLRKDRAI